MKGQVFKIQSNKYLVFCQNEYRLCVARGNLKNRSQKICVGDFVEFDNDVITSVYDRFSNFTRPNVANIECVNIVIGNPPKPDYILIDKIIAASNYANVKVYLTVNKCDLDSIEGDCVKDYVLKNYKNAVDEIFFVSALTGEGIEELKKALADKLVVFAGQSAVGKTTITNKLFGKDNKVGDVSLKTMRGRHTTTYSEIHIADGYKICDTPGFSQVELSFKSDELKDCYREFADSECFYLDCKHASEPHCAIKQKVERGEISRDRYNRYIEIFTEMKKEEKYAKY
ncbi:MAG: ribosome small subunit-dependent GTPase A [Christensenellaceae bacterium]